MKASLCVEAAERVEWPRLHSMGRPRSCDRMPSLIVDRGPILRVLGWALTRMRDIPLSLQCSREEHRGAVVCGTEP